MSILTETHLLAKLCEASGFQPSTAKSHLHKGYLVGLKQEIEGGADTGQKRRFPFSTIMQAAIAKEMINLGVAPERAFRAAVTFAHVGTGRTMAKDSFREAGVPFPEGDTLLLVWDEGQTVVHQKQKTKASDLRSRVPGQKPFITVPCNPVFDRVAVALGHHPQAALDEVYS